MKGPRGPLVIGTLAVSLGAWWLAPSPVVGAPSVVSFEDLAPETIVSSQYQGGYGLTFAGPPVDGDLPVVKAVGPGIAHSGSQVADISVCPGCEFQTSRTVGRLSTEASQVEAYVGYLGAPSSASAQVTLTARDAGGSVVGTPSTVTVVQGQPFGQQVSVTAPGATIASFELEASPPNMAQPIGVDDLALTYPSTAEPPDISLEIDSAHVPAAPAVDVPITIHRLNGSDGPVTLSASGLAAGMNASFQPNPVTGTGSTATLHLTAAPDVELIEQPITVTATPGTGAGSTPRSVDLEVGTTPDCDNGLVEVAPALDQRRVSSAAQLAKVLATATDMTVIVPAGVDWEMVDCAGAPLRSIELLPGVALVGEAGPLGRRPRLWTRVVADEGSRNLPLFKTGGDRVEVRGLHLAGPFKPKDHGGEKGVEAIQVTRSPLDQGRIVITDNEIDGFRNAVNVSGWVQVVFPADYQAAYEEFYGPCDGECPHPDKYDAPLVLVEGNYIHNQARVGGGYGVVVGGTAYATVRGNVFEYNNHSLAASGKAFSGYVATRNFLLKGAIDPKDHQFDVHGTRDSHHAGGPAGTYFDISYNTVRGEQTYALGTQTRRALGLRGRPAEAARFHHNVLVHDDFGEAVKLSPGGDPSLIPPSPALFNLSYHDNKHDTDYSTEIAAGDFDGDRRTDVFLATGTAWFFSSAGIRPWEYLTAATTRTKDLAFADVDNDGVTDVVDRAPGGQLRYFTPSASATPVVLPSSPVAIGKLRFGDFDGDGRRDIFYTSDGRWHVWYGGGPAAWSLVGSSITPLAEMLFGDFDSVPGTDLAAVRNQQWSYSSGATEPWAKLNSKRTSSFAGAVAADFDGNGRTDIAVTAGRDWRYSADGRGPLGSLRKGGVTPSYPRLDQLLVGRFDGGPRAQVLSWKMVPRLQQYVPEWRFVLWRGLGKGDGFAARSEQNMR